MRNLLLKSLSLFIFVSCNGPHNKCSYEDFDNFDRGKTQEKILFKCVMILNESNFRGFALVREDSLSYGWHEGELNNSAFIHKSLKEYKFYGVSHINEVSYFKKEAGFIDNSCGIMFVPNNIEIPNEVISSQLLIDKGMYGKWYFVEAKL